MKASAPLLIIFAIAAGCSDATNFPNRPTAPNSVAERGNVPPPPADVAVAVCTAGGCAVFEGTYMSNEQTASGQLSVPMSFASFSTAAAPDGGVCTNPGHAFLQIDKPLESDVFDDFGETSASAQIKCHQGIATGNGTLQIGAVVVDFDRVELFSNQPDCAFSCGQFVVRDEEGNDIATGIIVDREAFEQAFCRVDRGEGGPTAPVCFPGEGGPD